MFTDIELDIKMAFGGGGNRLAISLQRGEEAEEDTKLLGHYGAKVVSGIKGDRTIRRKDDKFETEKVVLVDSSSEHESIVGWGCYPNNEKLIQLYLSPEFLNSLSFIKKFYPLPVGARGKFIKVAHENSSNSRHSERQRKNPAYYCNTSKLKGIHMKNFSETDHTSMPLGIFASKSVSLLGWKAQPTSNVGGVGTPPYVASKYDVGIAMPTYFKDLAAWLPSCLAAKKVAFTLAEVLVTLGIIGVVAALTLPTVINKVQSMILKNQFKKAYSSLLNAINLVQKDEPVACWYWDKKSYASAVCTKRNEYGTCIAWDNKLADGSPVPVDYNGNFSDCDAFYPNLRKTLKVVKYCEKNALKNGCVTDDFRGVDKVKQNLSPDTEQDPGQHFSDSNVKNLYSAFLTPDGVLYIHWAESYSPYFAIDINGHKGPNKWGYDLYKFVLIGNKSNGITNIRSEAAVVEKGGKTIIEMINTP